MKPLLIAHRGDTVNYPQHTLDAYASAFEKGSDGIEVDVHYLRGSLVVVHDYLYDRSLSYPRLSDVLDEFGTKGRIEIEIKSMDLDFLSPLCALLHEFEHSDIEVTTSVWPIVSYLRDALPRTLLGFIFSTCEKESWMPEDFYVSKILKYMALTRANVAHVPQNSVSQSLVRGCHANGTIVHTHINAGSMNEQVQTYQQLSSWEVDQCTFDDIRLLEVIRKNNG